MDLVCPVFNSSVPSYEYEPLILTASSMETGVYMKKLTNHRQEIKNTIIIFAKPFLALSKSFLRLD